MIKEHPLKIEKYDNIAVEKKFKVGLLLGGSIGSEHRTAILRGERPRVDVLEMEKDFQAQLYDYDWIEERAKDEWITNLFLTAAKRLGQWSEILSLRTVWAIRKNDVVYATGEDVGLTTAILLRLLRMKKPRIFMRMEQPVFGRTPFRRSLYKLFFRFAAQRIDVILCRTQAHADTLQDLLKVSEDKVFFTPETTDTIFFDPKTSTVDLPALDSIPRPYIVSAGLELRDYDALIEAVEGLPVTAIICAGSPWAKVSYNRSVSDLPENVIVTSFSRSEMRELYRDAAFVVLPIKPTDRACGMNVVLEAWAMGRAVIASQTGGLKSYIEDGVTGIFVAPEDVGELRSAIQNLLQNPHERERLGKNGFNEVTTELTVERYLETVWSTIERIINGANKDQRYHPNL